MNTLLESLRRNRTRIVTLTILIVLLLIAIQGLSTRDWLLTVLRGLAVGAITFLVASGFSLIFGLLDVLNLAHGTLFMVGAYIGWTVYVRPDTFVDLLPPLLIFLGGALSRPIWGPLLGRAHVSGRLAGIVTTIGLLAAAGLLIVAVSGWPVAKWDTQLPSASPSNDALQLDLTLTAGQARPAATPAEPAAPAKVVAILVAGTAAAVGLAAFSRRRGASPSRFRWKDLLAPGLLAGVGLAAYVANNALTGFLAGLSTTAMFFIAIGAAVLTGAGLGALMETTLIRPLYARPIYQLMLTLGLGVAGIELVRSIWGRPEFIFPKPELFRDATANCPATSLIGLIQNRCSILALPIGGEVARIRFYNEIFVILVGLVVLVGVWLLLQRSRIGMIIRAGVQDSEMVEALGINVRQVFTLVFAFGVGLAALGGIIAAPSMGLSPLMGDSLLLQALIALAIGGLTSFPGAAAGSVLVGLLQQFIIKYGQIGIHLPFMAEPFKPTPPLVPASTVLLMVIILLLLPQGLFGRKE
jgi:branched-chain amino acid transport system permease protein